MSLWIAIDFAGGSLKYLGFRTLRKPKHVDCALHAGLHRLDGIMLVMHRARRAG